MSEVDQYLIESLKKGDEQALKQIFNLYFKRLHSFSTEFVIDREIAREIVHDSILRFWQHRDQLLDDTNIRAYLLKIVRNLCINHLKKFKNNPLVLLPDDEYKQELLLNYDVLVDQNWDKLLVSELEEVIEHIISSLPEKCKRVFEMSRFENMSNLEIAEKLNISVKTVEGHITEALKTLRIKLSKYLKIILLVLLT